MKKHREVYNGKHIRIILKNGDRFIDKLIEAKDTYYKFEQKGKVWRADVRSFSVTRRAP